MRYLLGLRVHGLYVRALERRGWGIASGPLVVHESGFVLDACDSASLRGVEAGMPLGQARALLSGGRFVELEHELFEGARTRWLDRLVPFADAIQPLSAHEAVIDLSAHPRPEELVPQVVRSVAEVEPRVAGGTAQAVWLARLAVTHQGDAVADPARFLAPLSVLALSPVELRHRERLRALGTETVGDLQKVSLDALRRQFGREALTIRSAALGQIAEPVSACYPPDSLSGYVPIEGGTGSAETLEAVLDRLSVELGTALARSDRQTVSLSAFVEHERHGQTLRREFSKPITDTHSLRAALRLLVPLAHQEEVFGLRVTIANIVRKATHQAALFGQQADTERITPAISRLSIAFGANTVRRASEIPIPRRIRFLRAISAVTGWR